MTAVIEIHQEGDAVVAIRAAMARLGDFTQLLPKLGEFAMDSQKLNIEESRSPEGEKFADLANPREPGHPYGDKPLLDTTNMYQSIHYEVRTADSVLAGPSMNQAPYFPFVVGGRWSSPARNFIGLRRDDPNGIQDLTAEHCAAALGI